jgi:hypothetical protein
MKPTIPLLALAFTLVACGGGNDQAEVTADSLENAAEQSDPAAAGVLENAADQVRETGSPAAAQGALEAAGNAQAATVAQGQSQTPPAQQGAKPHAPGDPVPPPKVQPGNTQ